MTPTTAGKIDAVLFEVAAEGKGHPRGSPVHMPALVVRVKESAADFLESEEVVERLNKWCKLGRLVVDVYDENPGAFRRYAGDLNDLRRGNLWMREDDVALRAPKRNIPRRKRLRGNFLPSRPGIGHFRFNPN